MMHAQHEPLEHTLERTIERLERGIRGLEATSRRFSWARLAIVLTGVVAALVAVQLGVEWLGWAVAGVFIGGFAVTAHFHGRLERGIRRRRFWQRIKAGHLARMRHEWEAIPLPQHSERLEGHPFENDLNITGPRSLLHLIDTAVSRGGSDRLRSWFLDSSTDVEVIRSRQTLVAEMAPLTGFRDRLTLAAALVARDPARQWDGERVMAWLERNPPRKSLRNYIVLLGILAAVNITLITLYQFSLVGMLWPFTLLAYVALYLYKRGEFESLFGDAVDLDMLLHQLRAVFLHLERFGYGSAPNLARLCAPFRAPGRKPSTVLSSVSRIVTAAGVQGNPLARVLMNLLMPWDLYFAERLNKVKGNIRDDMPVWLDRWYELEALGSLANFAGLNPEYVMPEVVVAESAAPVFDAVGLGHPLIPARARVRNDFSVDRLGQLSIVTGSNMSGKSTFLRTLGVNLSLAFAGGPVCGATFRTVPFRLFTCINVVDSVNDGISYFYAEVRRLKALLAALRMQEAPPLFFLIDEIFRGTNNRERLIGSRSYTRALVGANGTGLISTHDLELVHLADELPGIRNFHFREDVLGGVMVFDYRLREGPSPTTNALEIMRMEGLPVEERQ